MFFNGVSAGTFACQSAGNGILGRLALACIACVSIPAHLICPVSDWDTAVEMACVLWIFGGEEGEMHVYLPTSQSTMHNRQPKTCQVNISSNNLPSTVAYSLGPPMPKKL
jgi:hypothetical protein